MKDISLLQLVWTSSCLGRGVVWYTIIACSPRFYLIFYLAWHLGAKKFHHATGKSKEKWRIDEKTIVENARGLFPLCFVTGIGNQRNELPSIQANSRKLIGTSGETIEWRNFSNDASKRYTAFENFCMPSTRFPTLPTITPYKSFCKKAV